ncbi:hypothetical protein [Paraburkholderia sp. Clong3]|uniref:hypothetical protein n=1 Tax=Paraburkholderia sp. Clong3 TaxID=2991061 RepID=UPI003D21977A
MTRSYFDKDGNAATLVDADLPIDAQTRELFETLRAEATAAGLHTSKPGAALVSLYVLERD